MLAAAGTLASQAGAAGAARVGAPTPERTRAGDGVVWVDTRSCVCTCKVGRRRGPPSVGVNRTPLQERLARAVFELL